MQIYELCRLEFLSWLFTTAFLSKLDITERDFLHFRFTVGLFIWMLFGYYIDHISSPLPRDLVKILSRKSKGSLYVFLECTDFKNVFFEKKKSLRPFWGCRGHCSNFFETKNDKEDKWKLDKLMKSKIWSWWPQKWLLNLNNLEGGSVISKEEGLVKTKLTTSCMLLGQ